MSQKQKADDSSAMNESQLKNNSAFMVKNQAIKVEFDLDIVKKRIKKLQIDEQKQRAQGQNLNSKVVHLKQIYEESNQERQEKQQRRLEREQSEQQLHQKNLTKRGVQQTQLKNIRESLQELKHKDMQDISNMRKKHEEIIKQIKQSEIEQKRKQKEEIKKMELFSKEIAQKFLNDKVSKTQDDKLSLIQQSQKQMTKIEQEMHTVMLEEERLRKKLEKVSNSTKNAYKTVIMLPKQNNIANLTSQNTPKTEQVLAIKKKPVSQIQINSQANTNR